MFVRRTIETHEEAGIRPSKPYQSFVAAAGSHRELGFIEKDVRKYITREVRNISEKDDAKEFGKYLVRMKEKNQNFFFELNLEGDHCIKHAFWADARSRDAFNYFGDVVSFDTTYNTNRYNLVLGFFIGVNHHESEEFTRILHQAFDKIMTEMEEYQERRKGKSLLTHEEATLSNVNDLQNPPRIKTRGRPKNRLGSNLKKKISNAMKKKKDSSKRGKIDLLLIS
ncbi:hypothetical protein Ahy_B09g096317 isoform D [Arachis hypogaea]|uniref:Uncharacterized protein n=1 Tax=Arachis hypogaea TaxID=3818 RepID=A0A444XJS2_ARAHY|nr:hypothetical protein Ahy_B09g096317 isoform D [Arachis hypogaea]